MTQGQHRHTYNCVHDEHKFNGKLNCVYVFFLLSRFVLYHKVIIDFSENDDENKIKYYSNNQGIDNQLSCDF